ncbi:MAG: hypothetical protein ACKVTZ_06695 [Bacteroidia bacterium]
MRTFGSFTFDVVEKMFGIQEVDSLPLLTDWTENTPETEVYYERILTQLRKKLFKKAHIWNEDELKMFFIGTLIELADIGNDVFQPFTQRMLSMKHQSEEIGGRVDFLIAKGRRVPELPYLCIHEYKQETDKEGDPLGQLLIAMATAQVLNQNEHPILGSYIIGRNWFFVVLAGNCYCKSREYDASSEDIFQIFAILQKSKEIIQGFV